MERYRRLDEQSNSADNRRIKAPVIRQGAYQQPHFLVNKEDYSQLNRKYIPMSQKGSREEQV